MSKKIILQTISRVFALLAVLGLFLTCDGPNSPFSNNQGLKVVVEPPTIFDISPVSGSFLTGTVTFTATAKAYIKVEKVEVYIYEDKDNGQKEVPWNARGIQLTGSVKLKTMTYEFDSTKYNSGNDGPIRMKFRIFDSTDKPVDSIQLVYIIKNNPSDIKMAYPSDTDVFTMAYSDQDIIDGSTELPKIPWKGDIRGQITDRRGIKPGYPQIKLWPYKDKDDNIMDEPPDNDPQWGWASLFLSCDDMEKGSDPTTANPAGTPAGFGRYEDRRNMRVLNYSSFSLHLAEYKIEVDPANPDLRRIVYRIGKAEDTAPGDNGSKYIGKHVPFDSGRVFNFRIRTRDVAPDPLNGSYPTPDPVPLPAPPPWLEGHYPPTDFRTPSENKFEYRGYPVKIRIFSSDTQPIVEINNDDIEGDLGKTPNKYITDYTSYKIAQTGFRLRLFVTFEEGKAGIIEDATFAYKKSPGMTDPLPLAWDGSGIPIIGTPDKYDYTEGIVEQYVDKEGRTGNLYTFTAPATIPPAKPPIFEKFNGYYTLIFTLKINGVAKEYPFTLYIDGDAPKVNIYSIHGSTAAVNAPTDVKGVTYTVNGNIQVVVNSTDERGIMAFTPDTGMGKPPYINLRKPLNENKSNIDDGRPMVKWIIEKANKLPETPAADNSAVWKKLDEYEKAPTYEKLEDFFLTIQDERTSSFNLLPSGWVKRELDANNPDPDLRAKIDADKSPHFKINTTTLEDKECYWLYVIAMDQVRNLGFAWKKIYVDQSTDNPKEDIRPLSQTNATGTAIADENGLDVTVGLKTEGGKTFVARTGGNWKDEKRNNVLRDEGITLNFVDDDGISLDKGGVKITLTDLNVTPNKTVTLSLAQIKEALNETANSGSKKDFSGTLSQAMMERFLYGSAPTGRLKDGMYKIEFTVIDDTDQKVELKPPQYPGDQNGDTPPKAAPDPPKTIAYYFAVSRDLPVITITQPDNNAMGSSEPQDLYGEVKSRFTMQGLWITFDPNVVVVGADPSPIELPLTLKGPPATSGPDEGYYIYTWNYKEKDPKGIIFNPAGGTFSGDVRNFTVEAYDRIGNLSTEKRTVIIDTSAPEITLVEFNYGRPADPADDNLYVYGKVSFTVSASAKNGLSETEVNGVKYSGIKWWVLPASVATPPSWDTPFTSYTNTAITPDPWTGGGNFRLDQEKSGGKYTGVIDTRYLAEKPTPYKFYYMARDKAGRTTFDTVILQPNIDLFRVDQSRDYPVIYENDLNPLPNSVLGDNNLIISGRVSDADLFATNKLGLYTASYVEIRFPKAATTGKPAKLDDWDSWIPIFIPDKYSTRDGGIDSSKAIVYKFNISDTKYTGAAVNAARTYLGKDGIKYYQIRVTDEPDAGDDGRNYGKNPDGAKANIDANYHGSVSIIFPQDPAIFPPDPLERPANAKPAENPPDAYVFFVDNTPPEIFFNLYDPTEGHENYLASRPTFSSWEQLRRALNNEDPITGAQTIYNTGNHVKEYKLIDLSMSWSAVDGAGNDLPIFTKVIRNNPADPKDAGIYLWDLSEFTGPHGTSGTDDNRFKTTFEAAKQGLQIISFEATDMVPKKGRVSWTFTKDTQGPDILFSTINRAIKREPPPAYAPGIPAGSDFPASWPPNKTVWDTAWSTAWENLTRYWPSEYAFRAAADVIKELEKENKLSPTTVIGDDSTPAVIQGSFEDEYSSIVKLVPADAKTYFYYRFKDKKGTVLDIPDEINTGVAGEPSTGTGTTPLTKVTWPKGFTDKDYKPWIQKEVKKGKTEREAEWEITLNKQNGFTGTDGENLLDIRVADSADNVSEIYNVRFLLDSAPPLLGRYEGTLPSTDFRSREFEVAGITSADPKLPGPLDVDKRVFSASVTGAGDETVVFSVRGRVNDYNLNNLRITMGQDNYTGYTVTTSVDIDPLSTALSSLVSPNSTGTGVIKAPADVVSINFVPPTTINPDSSNLRRLKLRGPLKAGTDAPYDDTGTPEWEWTFDILKKDVYGLRAAAGIGSDYEFSTRRFIRVTAADKAGKREGPVEWAFYLDTRKPTIEYTNLEKGRNGSSFESDVKLSVLVSDDTKIKDVRYTIGRWNYTTGVWNWYDSASSATDKWILTAPPDLTKWPSVFKDDKTPTRLTSMDFTINQTMLDAAPANTFPAKLFDTEGQYRIDLCVTDFSVGNGNAHDTRNGDNSETDTGFRDTGYDPKTGAGNASARVFYIDKKDPTLRWASVIEEKTYFRNETATPNIGQVIFGFIAGDGNTLKSWTAVVRDKNGIVKTTTGNIEWDAGKEKTTIAIPEPETVATTSDTPDADKTTPATTAGHKISDTSIYEQYFVIKPFMTDNALSGGTPWDKVPGNSLPTYSITITVTDGANRTSSITKQFTLDNTPPVFVQEKYNPLSYKRGTGTDADTTPAPSVIISTDPEVKRDYSYDAVTGRMNIRGNTTDNSNQIKRVAYYVVNEDDSANWTNFPTPKYLTDNKKWRYSGGTGNESSGIPDDASPFIQIDQGTFAWKIMVPRTSEFFTNAAAAKYMQETKTGGTAIDGTKNITPGTYADVLSISESAVTMASPASQNVPYLTFPDLNNKYYEDNPKKNPKVIYGNEKVGLITVYVLAEDAAGNVAYDVLKYWIWPEGDRPIVTVINTPNENLSDAERLLNGTIRIAGMAKDNERVKNVWFRVMPVDKFGVVGAPYTNLHIPEWDESDWSAKSAEQTPVNDDGTGTFTRNAYKGYLGDRRIDDPSTTQSSIGGGWYKANGGNSPSVSWWAYINTNGELNPDSTDTDGKRRFRVEVRAQDTTFNEKDDVWVTHSETTGGYRGFASTDKTVDAWVVSEAPTFKDQLIAPDTSVKAEAAEITPPTPNPNRIWADLDSISIRNRSSYKVTVEHNLGLSAIRWSPTLWDKTMNSNNGAFQANPKIDAFNLLSLDPGQSVWIKYLDANDSSKIEYVTGTDAQAKTALDNKDTSIALRVSPKGSLIPGTSYYQKYDVFVDMNADILLEKMTKDDPAYGNGSAGRAGQTINSVRYPLYMTASEVSKATPLTTRGDALLPIDNKIPYGMYTLNRKPAGTAVTIGGVAGDDGPVNGVARVVLWFQRKDAATLVSWHERAPIPETTLPEVPGPAPAYDDANNPSWWQNANLKNSDGTNVIPATGVTKPNISNKPPHTPSVVSDGTGGDWAIVIDRNSPSVGYPAWGHTLPMGFADGDIGKIWYVQINSYGLQSGPIDLHYVVIDKAGNAKYYKERLIIMNDVAVIDRVKLATDIRHNSSSSFSTNKYEPAGAKINDKATALTPSQWPVLKDIRAAVPLGGSATDINDDVKKGISDWVSAPALGADKVIDFNVRNNLFALRVETTKKPASDKARTFSLEYISGANLFSDTGGTNRNLTDIKAGNIYMINDPGTARWGTFGAEGDTWKRGYAFIATVSGSELDDLSKAKIGTGSAWEITTALPLSTTPSPVGDATAESAEFQYGTGAFSTIVDCKGPEDEVFPPTGTWGPTWTNNNWSLFVLRVYDGDKSDYFGDFTILRVRVNNNDKSLPFAQLYDFNPKTEGQDRSNIAGNDQAVEKRRSVSPMFIGESAGSNRTKGGLWNDSDKLGSVEKPGHIEPRRNGSGATATHPSLTSAQMGGAATKDDATITKPFADPQGFIDTTDLVSGQVVLRGYAEDDQRVQRVSLVIGGQTIHILDYYNNRAENTTTTAYGYGTAGDSATYTSPKTGLLQIATGTNAAPDDRVFFSDSIDLYRHRVEWAYIWDTETIPGGANLVGNDINVRVIAYPRNGADGTGPQTTGSDEIKVADGKPHVSTPDLNDSKEKTRPNTSPYNKDFPVGLIKYNSINVNLRPYITGFLRNKTQFAHDTRSRQGRYMFARNETAVVKGFNLGTGSISINGSSIATADVGTPADFGIETDTTKLPVVARNRRYRQFTVGTGVTTGSGLVTYTYSSRDAVNTGGERAKTTTPGSTTPNYVPPTARPNYIQPWNIEYSPGVDGSQLWDDFTQVHIWQSNDNAPGGANDTAANASGRFYVRNNAVILNPAMSIDPRTGLLYESHNESGSGGNGWYNTGTTKKSGINNNDNETVTQFADPIFFSDVYRSPGNGTDATSAGTWAVSSIIGRSSSYNFWRALGGIYINGPDGRGIAFCGGGTGSVDNNPSVQDDTYSKSLYHGESAWYNASSDSGRAANPPATDQFMNPRIVTSYDGGREHIHVSYYDEKDGSIKYRYNLRGTTGTIDGGNQPNVANNMAIPKMWTNLDGGFDAEDTDATTYTTGGDIAANARVVNYTTRNATPVANRANAGKHNSIAVTGNGYPVVAYYASDSTGQRLKLAVSNSVSPVLANAWTIRDNISGFGTGEFVSMKIDTKASPNVVHIAALNTNKRLVYITFTLNVTSGGTPELGTKTEQVVDSVGNVGRWCALSLDERGNPWISYMDESWVGARDGAKVAYKDVGTFYKGSSTYRNGEDKDINGENISGWEAMHVPTLHRVENPIEGNGREHGRLGMECFPARNYAPNNNVTRFWSGAVSYLSRDAEMNGNTQVVAPMDRYRIAYYVK